jgi:REP-associated tyrosine transposase
MSQKYPTYWPQFYTATIIEWKQLLKQDKYKQIILEALQFLVSDKRTQLYAFVIMSNHFHLIWQPLGDNTPQTIQHSLMTRTAQQIKADLGKNHPQVLPHFKVNVKDRSYQFWERNSLGVELFSNEVFMQKLDYIHYNPVKAGLCKLPSEYHYSSAKFYETGIDDFGILTHCNE